MKWDDYKALIQDEKGGRLRNSVLAEKSSLFQNAAKRYILDNIVDLIQYEGSVDDASKYQLAYNSLRIFCSLEGDGSPEKPYRLWTEFGGGGFIDVHYFFKDRVKPSWIKNNQCHNNSYDYACITQEDCEVLTGIYNYNHKCRSTHPQHLHSVVKIKGLVNIILDFNWGVAMCEEMYLQLFNFEILNRVDAKDIKKNNDFIVNNLYLIPDLTYPEMLACYDEILEYIKKNSHNKKV